MQSHNLAEAEAEISSIPSNTSCSKEPFSAINDSEGAMTGSSMLLRTSSPARRKHSTIEASRFATSGSIIGDTNQEGRERGDFQNIESPELHKASIPSTELRMQEVQRAEDHVACDRGGDRTGIGGEKRTSVLSAKALSDTLDGNDDNMAKSGKTRKSRRSFFDDSEYPRVPTKSGTEMASSIDHGTSRPDTFATNTDENGQSGRIDVSDPGNCNFVEHGGRFSVPPPKYSNLYSVSLDQEGVPLSTLSFEEQKQVHTSLGPSSTLQQISERENTMPPSSIQHAREDSNITDNNLIGAVTGDDEQSDIILHNLGAQEDDTLLGIPEEEKSAKQYILRHDEKYQNEETIHSNKNLKDRRRTRQRRKQQILESQYTDDEMSIENSGAANASQLTGLQERAHQAWKSRQRKNTNMRLRNDSKSQSNKISNVSFGVSDTIHHFDPGDQKKYKFEKEGQEEMSLDQSLNSEYTKTLESEVEDMIKDILFIGNPQKSKPGRRKYRYKTDGERKPYKDQRSKSKMDSGPKKFAESSRMGEKSGGHVGKTDDDTSSTGLLDERYNTVNDSRLSKAEKRKSSRSKYPSSTYGDDTCSAGSTISRGSSVDSNTVETFQSENDGIEDPMNTVLGLVEGGLSVVTSAIGYALGDPVSTESKEDNTSNRRKSSSDFDIFESCGIHIHDEKVETPPNRKFFARTDNIISKSALIDQASDVVPINPKNSSSSPKKAQRLPDVRKEQGGDNRLIKGERNKADRETTVNGAELIVLAMYAARSIHKLQGVEYDESVVIDTYKEVKKCHVTLELPLGIIFLENDGGCFVTKVSPDGSAARSRKVMVGDQLASINGASGSKMRVDDICDAVARSSDQGQVDLIFLRYIGPFRPSNTVRRPEEGSAEADNTIHYTHQVSNTSRSKKSTKKITGFRLFGRGKKNSNKSNAA